MTHRDPVDVVGSACSLVWNVRVMLSDKVDREQLGRDMVETFEAHGRAAKRFPRETRGEAQFTTSNMTEQVARSHRHDAAALRAFWRPN